MAETHRAAEALRAGRPLVVGAAYVLPIERIVRHAHAGPGHARCWLAMQPHAVVVLDASGLYAFGVDAAAIDIDELRRAVPGLEDALRSMRPP